mmetsp:Transcript_7754/g.17871  ORF Transcript_7754/g.17871 Transcript_7754/m.17871 type:complete len:95 (+) Transcript_7754:257-541(+)
MSSDDNNPTPNEKLSGILACICLCKNDPPPLCEEEGADLLSPQWVRILCKYVTCQCQKSGFWASALSPHSSLSQKPVEVIQIRRSGTKPSPFVQ